MSLDNQSLCQDPIIRTSRKCHKLNIYDMYEGWFFLPVWKRNNNMSILLEHLFQVYLRRPEDGEVLVDGEGMEEDVERRRTTTFPAKKDAKIQLQEG